MNQIVAQDDIVRGPYGVFTGQLDAEIAMVGAIALHDDLGAAIDVDPRCGLITPTRYKIAAVAGIVGGIDVIDRVAAAHAVAGAVDAGGSGTFVSDEVDADIVAVVHDVIAHSKICDVAIEGDGLALTSAEVIDFVTFEDEGIDRRCARSIDGDAETIRALVGAALPDVMDLVTDELDASSGAFHLDAYGDPSSGGGGEIADLETLNH